MTQILNIHPKALKLYAQNYVYNCNPEWLLTRRTLGMCHVTLPLPLCKVLVGDNGNFTTAVDILKAK